jgi:steroid Delta-isomerase
VTDDVCACYIRFLETLTPKTLDGIDAFVTDDVVFRDPFNAVQGREAMVRVLRRMFDDLSDVRFHVTAHVSQMPVAFIAWELSGITKRSLHAIRLIGVSQLTFAKNGQVSMHIDHWDAASQFYETLPGLGFILRKIRQRLSAHD